MAGSMKKTAKALFTRLPEQQTAAESGRKKWLRYGVAAAGVWICLCMGVFIIGTSVFAEQKIDSSIGMAPLGEGECYVPNVTGMRYEEAEAVLAQKHFKVVIDNINYSGSIKKDKILSQSPEAGNIAAAEDTIHIVKSGGTEEVMMPDFADMTCEEAKELANAQHLVILDEKQEEYHDHVAKGRIITQSIEPKERVAVQTELSLTVSLGRLSEETAVLAVPDLTGLTQEQALKRLEKLRDRSGFTYSIGDIRNRYSAKVKKGDIISQSPEADARVRTNEPVSLVISRGPEMIQVPQVVNQTKEKAVKKLEKAGFSADVKTEYSAQVSEGLVIRQSKKDGVKAAKGSSIKIVVSLGVQPVQNTISSNNSAAGSGQSGNSSSGSSGAGKNSPGSSSSTNNAGTGSSSANNQTQSGNGNSSNNSTDGNQQQPDVNTGGTRIVMPDGSVIVVE